MSTFGLLAERMKQRALLIDLCESLCKQNAELEELEEMHAKGARRAEDAHEKLIEQIEDISKANALGTEGGRAPAMLARIRAELLRLNNLVEDWERYKTLVRLCMAGEVLSGGLTMQAMRLIYVEVERLKEQELPF